MVLTNGAKRAIDDWVAMRGHAPGPLLVPVDAFGVIRIRRLHDQTMFEICRRLAARAGIAAFSPQDLRRTFAGDMLDAGADVALVQRLMGHSSVATTVVREEAGRGHEEGGGDGERAVSSYGHPAANAA